MHKLQTFIVILTGRYRAFINSCLVECKYATLTTVSTNFIILTGRVMFTVKLSLGGRGYEREVTIALFEMDAGISELRTFCYGGTDE